VTTPALALIYHIIKSSLISIPLSASPVSQAELLRLKKRFMKLDQDGSGTITREEFLSIPAIANNPLAHRMIAIFDTE
jgi:serine/threonine-protein phosphatase 2B regulatory subunit